MMYEPFERAIDEYPEVYERGPDHLKTPEAFAAFLEKCDTCRYRRELRCRRCRCGNRNFKPCIRMAELPNRKCPLEAK